MSENVYRGTPSLALLPAKEYVFTLAGEKHRITIPIRGNYSDLDPSFYKDGDGGFDLFVNKTINLPEVSKVLFATKKYPELGKNQLFVPIAMAINGDNMEIIGEIMEIQGGS